MSCIISDEFERLKIVKKLLEFHANKEVFIDVKDMDDAALVKIDEKYSFVIASDFIRGSGFYLFQLGFLDYFDVGYYLIAANLSDIAAMGAEPKGLTSVIRYNNEMNDYDFTQIFMGMKQASDDFNTPIIGGDIGGYEKDVFSATAFGIIETEKALLRHNVQENDLLCITGTVGLPISALVYFKELKETSFKLSELEEQIILKSWKRPVARIKEGRFLADNKIANGCLDVSDGVKSSIEQLSAFSDKSFTIYSNKIPIHDITKKISAYLKKDPVSIAISSSVDFELMFTVPVEKINKCNKFFIKIGVPLTVIGKVNKDGKNKIINDNGSESILPGISWKQQKGDEYLKNIIG